MRIDEGARTLTFISLPPSVSVELSDGDVYKRQEYGMGVSVLSRLMLRGLSQNVVTLPLSDPVFRTIGVAYRSAGHLPLATRRFLDYLEFRKEEE